MNRFSSAKFLVAATLATAALGAATVAEARPDVYFSVDFQNGPAWADPAPVYVHRQPVYVQPQPVFVQPEPVYVRPPVFAAPREVFERPRWGGYEPRFESERGRTWRNLEWREKSRGADRGHDRDGRMHHHDLSD